MPTHDKKKKRGGLPDLSKLPQVTQAKEVGTFLGNVGKSALELYTGKIGIPKGKYQTPQQIKELRGTLGEGRARIRGGVKKFFGVSPTPPQTIDTTVTPMTEDRVSHPIPPGFGQPKAGGGKGTVFDVPEKYQAKFGKKYLTNRGIPDFTKADLGFKESGGATYSLGGKAGIPPWMEKAEAERAETGGTGGIPKMDFSNWPNIIKSLGSLVPFAAKTGIARDRLKREKAALSMGLDRVKLNKVAAEALAVPASIEQKQAQTALSKAKEQTERTRNKKTALEVATDPLTGEVDFKRAYELEQWLSGGGRLGGGGAITQEEIDAAVKKYGISEEEVKKRYAKQYGISEEEIEVTE